MNKLKRKNKGITLITLVIAVTILIIISSLLVYNAKNGIKMRNLKMMYNDIELLSDKVEAYNAKYGALPAEIEYWGTRYFSPEPNDNDKYYVIDLHALDGISLNYGSDFENITSEQDTLNYDNLYIINEQSHHIYYARGIEMDGVLYYTADSDDEITLQDKVDKPEEPEPILSVNLTLTYNNIKLDPNDLPNVKEVTNENVPIPQGFYYVRGTKDEGVVISDVSGDDLNNSKKGNQFVWVPVNQNQKLMLEVESSEEIKEIIVTNAEGEQSSIEANGKTYNDEIPMTKNGIYKVDVKTETMSETATKRVSSLYAQDMIFIEKSFSNPSFLEDRNQNLESVNKYGGFYIGRYEAGDGVTTSPRTSSTSDTNTLVSKKGAYVYNYISVYLANSLSRKMYSTNLAVSGQLITGAGWDRTLNWIIETEEKTEEEVLIDSSGWGNYYNSSGNASIDSGPTNMNYTTGRSEYWKANNIYDLAGNTMEWTQETYQNTSNGVPRGGDYHFVGNSNPAGDRDFYTSGNQSMYYSFRTQLYINV